MKLGLQKFVNLKLGLQIFVNLKLGLQKICKFGIGFAKTCKFEPGFAKNLDYISLNLQIIAIYILDLQKFTFSFSSICKTL